jgi:hypothetical protein
MTVNKEIQMLSFLVRNSDADLVQWDAMWHTVPRNQRILLIANYSKGNMFSHIVLAISMMMMLTRV